MPRKRTTPRVRPSVFVSFRGEIDRGAGAPPSRAVLVVAGNYREYQHYCAIHHLNNRQAVYVVSTHTLLGRLLGRVVLVGTCEARRDWPTIRGQLARRGVVPERDE